jgi:hypothetical protein
MAQPVERRPIDESLFPRSVPVLEPIVGGAHMFRQRVSPALGGGGGCNPEQRQESQAPGIHNSNQFLSPEFNPEKIASLDGIKCAGAGAPSRAAPGIPGAGARDFSLRFIFVAEGGT